jgi:hypothetical protein
MTKKNKAIRPSLTQCPRSSASSEEPTLIVASVLHSDSYDSDHGELAHTRATSVAPRRSPALPASVSRNVRRGPVSCPSRIVRRGRGLAAGGGERRRVVGRRASAHGSAGSEIERCGGFVAP